MIFICACHDDLEGNGNEIDYSNGRVPIVLRASIGQLGPPETTRSTQSTRIVIDPYQDTLVYENEDVVVWTDYLLKGVNTRHLDAWNNYSNGEGALISKSAGYKYFPGGNSPIDIYAVHGNFSIPEGTVRPIQLSHTIPVDQTPPNEFIKADFLYAMIPQQKASDPIQIRFSHLLSKIQVCLQAEGSVSDADLVGAELYFDNILPTATLNFKEGTGVTEGTPTSIKAPYGVIPSSDPDFSNATYEDVILPPQVLAGIVMRLVLPNLGGREFYFVPPYSIPLVSGTIYRFNIHVNDPITLVPYVANWNKIDTLDHHADWSWRYLVPVVEDFEGYKEFRHYGWGLAPEVSQWNIDGAYIHWMWTLPPEVMPWNDTIPMKPANLTPIVNSWDSIPSNFFNNLMFNPVVNDWVALPTHAHLPYDLVPLVNYWDSVPSNFFNTQLLYPGVVDFLRRMDDNHKLYTFVPDVKNWEIINSNMFNNELLYPAVYDYLIKNDYKHFLYTLVPNVNPWQYVPYENIMGVPGVRDWNPSSSGSGGGNLNWKVDGPSGWNLETDSPVNSP